MLRLSSVRATPESLWSLCQSTSTILDPRIWPSTSSGQKYSHKTEPIVVLSQFKFLPFAQGKPTSAWIQGETLKWKSYLEGFKRIHFFFERVPHELNKEAAGHHPHRVHPHLTPHHHLPHDQLLQVLLLRSRCHCQLDCDVGGCLFLGHLA